MPLSFFSHHYQETFFVRDLHKLPHHKQNILLYEAELLLEDLECYLDQQRDSEDLNWIRRISRKIITTKKFAFYCRTVLKGNVQNKRMKRIAKQHESQIKNAESFIISCFTLTEGSLNSKDKSLMRLFFSLGQQLKVVGRNKQIKYFESYFEDCKDEKILRLALEVCLEYKYMNDPYYTHHLLPLISRAMKRQVKKLQPEASPCNDPDALAT